MPKEKITKENLYVYFNSLISISCISESGSNQKSKYLLRMENLEQALLLKICPVPLSDFSDLKESLFFIREIGGFKNSSLYDDKKEQNKFIQDATLNKENDENSREKRVNFNQQFILQHMISRNYIYAENIPGKNSYNLKLTSDVNSAVPFILERIHETRASQEFLTFKQSFYISIYLKEKDRLFYVNSSQNDSKKHLRYDIDSSLRSRNSNVITNENILFEDNNSSSNNIINNEEKDNDLENNYYIYKQNFFELNIEKNMMSKYLFVNQSWYIKNKNNIFSSQIINIIFINSNLYKDIYKANQIIEKEEQYMLSAECLDTVNEEDANDSIQEPEDTDEERIKFNKKNDSNYYYDINKGLIRLNRIKETKKKNILNQQITVKVIPYEKDFYKHVINNCFWVIEEGIYDYKEKLKKIPLKVGSQIKIKNVLLDLYLKVKKKGNGNNNNNIINTNNENDNNKNNEQINNQNIQKIKMDSDEENEYEFELVDEETLISKSFYLSNFIILHYNMNNKKIKSMNFNEKYSLRSIFREKTDHFDFKEINKYFQPISINIDAEKKYSLIMKNEDDFIFELRKMDIFESNHVIYIKTIIQNLNIVLNICKNKKIDMVNSIKIILLNISFFMNYLLNIEYIFRDEKYDINLPIKERQLILENFGILKSIPKISEYLISIREEIRNRRKKTNLNNRQNFLKSLYGNSKNAYQYKTLNQNININYTNVIRDTQKTIKIILEFLTFLSKDNEEIKEKIFLDLDIILKLAETYFVLDRSILLNFIFKIIDNSEVLQEYVTGGKLNLISSIKNSKGYNYYAEKESKNQLIRMDRILKYIEISHNYLFYYKKLLSLNKVKHKQGQIKSLIGQHIVKIDREYTIKKNYKTYLRRIILKSKKIINNIEMALYFNGIFNNTLAEKILNISKLKDSKTLKRKVSLKDTKSIYTNDESKDKNNSELGFFLNKKEDINLGLEKSNEEKKSQDEDSQTIDSKEFVKKKTILKKEEIKKPEKSSLLDTINLFKIFKDKFGTKKKEQEQTQNIPNKTIKEERINPKEIIDRSIWGIKVFLSFFEKFDMNNTLFITDKVFNELFESFDEAKNAKSKLSYVVNGDTKSIQLMDGIKIDPESELGQLIPFHLFNKFFPKFRSQNVIVSNENYSDSIEGDFDEDSDNDINYILGDDYNYGKGFNQFLFPALRRGITDNQTNILNKNTNLFKPRTIYNSNLSIKEILRRSKTNPFDNFKSIKNEDEFITSEKEQKDIEKEIKKLNKYLCILYAIYQFCINQYYDTLNKVLKIINNYSINYEFFCDMKLFKKNMDKIKDALLSKIVFLGNDILTKLYTGAKEKPTLLKGVFDFDKFRLNSKQFEENSQNIDLDIPLEDEQQGRSFKKNMTRKLIYIKELTQEEITLIKSLFYFCNKYDKINYIKDKIKYLRRIKNLIDLTPKKQDDNNNNNNNQINHNNLLSPESNYDIMNNDRVSFVDNTNNDVNSATINNEFIYILNKLYKKRNKILEAYIDIHIFKKELTSSIKTQKVKNSKNVVSLGYNIDKRIDIIVKMLTEYEIDNILGKLIYLDINKNSIYFDYNILKNLKLVQNNFKEIDILIKKIRIDYDRRGDNCLSITKDKNNNIIKKININNSNYNKQLFQKVNYCLSKMTINFLNFLNLDSNNLTKYKGMPKLSQMLYKENENFYKKIGFDKTFENLIETIDCFYDFDNNPMIKLTYCQEILRIFIEVQNIYKNFKEIIPEYFELYYNMIMKSLHSICLYKIDIIGEEEEKTFLKICYYSCESFILIIFNSKKAFGELRPFMIDILSKLLKIYSQLKNPKNKIIFQILYTYYISRVLLFISKEKYFDDFSYNSFFQMVFPMDKMQEQIFCCMDEIAKEESIEESSEEEESKTEEENLYENNPEEGQNDQDKNSPKSNKQENQLIEGQNNEQEFNYYHNNKYYRNFLKRMKEMKEMKEKKEIKANKNLIIEKKEKEEIIPEISQNEILWESEEEKEKLSFYLNYFSIYVLYLHDRNSIKKIRDNVNKEDNINLIEYDYKNLYSKIQKLLDDTINFTRSNGEQEIINIEAITHNNNNLSNKIRNNLNKLKLSILNNQETNARRKKNNYQFESVLVESIILYKYRKKAQNVEIPVKNYRSKNKIKDANISNDFGEGDKTSSASDTIKKLRTNNLINFYYYDNEYLDLIFLEKICNDIHISDNINYYCTNTNFDYSDERYEDLLQKILMMKKEYRLITSYYKGEYDKLHDQFINNDMEEFILLLKKRFTNSDFNRIYSMKKFLYKRMNEIYSEDLFNSENLHNRKIISFIELFKSIERTHFRPDILFENISLYSYLTSLIYIYPTYSKKTCVLFYKIGFQLLAERCRITNIQENPNKKDILRKNEEEAQYQQRLSMKDTSIINPIRQHTIGGKLSENDDIIKGLISIFSREVNRIIIQDDEVFFTMINSLILFLKEIKENNIYLSKSSQLIRELFTELDFAFDHIFQDFEKIVNFMKSAENQKYKDKYRKNEANLKIIIIFITTFLSLQKAGDNNLLTRNIIELIQNFTGQIIKLVLILIEIGKEDNMKTADMLIDFFYFFIEGPDINNLNSLFAFRFFNLVTFIITKVDYYKIFWNNINNIKLNYILDSYAKIECKILKIFFIYYNVAYNNQKNVKEYLRIREWYAKNYEYIKNKLKKLYYFHKAEIENRIFDIDKAIIYKKKDDSYSDDELFQRAGIISSNEIAKITLEEKLNIILGQQNFDEPQNDLNYINNDYYTDNENYLYENINNENILYDENNDMDLLFKENKHRLNKTNYCLIKFDLLLFYYTLNVYFKDIINEEYIQINTPTDSFCANFLLFFKKLFIFLVNIILCIYDLIRYLYLHVRERVKAKVELLQELNTIDEDSLAINEKDMFLDLSSKIKCVEISIDQILYKIYFPIIDKAKKIEENSEYYLYVENQHLPNYVSYIISNYDKIHISVTKNYYFDKLSEIPVVNLMFENIHLFGILLMIIGIITNLVILASYSIFTNDQECDCNGNESCLTDKRRLFCPRFFYRNNGNYKTINRLLRFFGFFQFIFQIMVLFDYICRNFSINWALSKDSFKIKKAKKTNITKNIKITKCEYIKIYFRTLWSIFTFQFIYYALYIIFVLLGYFKHPFFYAFTLLEIVNRVELMAAVLKSIYVPKFSLLINLIMFVMLEYFFSFFALSFFTSHFPNIRDTENFLQTFMRMLDQTFKQDGGIGTYLDQSLDPDYVQYTPKAYAGARFWFDFLFYFFTILLIFQMFTSIIFDYFMNTRKNKESYTKKSKTECLICGLKRENLEKIYLNAKDAFQKHTYHCHNIRNYINYLFYIQSLSYRDPIIEENVWNYHLENQNSYLPDKTCFQLKEKKILEAIKAKNIKDDKFK